MDLRWINKATKEIGVVFVTDDDVTILETIGYHHCNEDDFTDDEFDGALVEIWKPLNINKGGLIMKIKVFKFEVSNASSKAFSDDKQKDWYYTQQARLKTPNEIEDIINDFCKDKVIVDIKIQTVDVEYHNNGRGNTVELWYTIMYK